MEGIDKFLEERKKENLFRRLNPASLRKDGKIYFEDRVYIDFSSNDYLGLSNHPEIKQASRDAIDRFGLSASASRLLSGDLNIHHELEERVAALKGKESALVFNSGYQANIGIISAICGRADIIFSDRLNHASIVDGILLSGAKFLRFRHNDMEHLEDMLNKERVKYRESLIVTETIFSMDGDRPPLKDIVRLKEKYNCMLLVDEAHATGVFGKKGSGIVEEEGLADRIDLIMGTFGKALGSFGAYLACPVKVRDYLINSSRSFIYSTALPPSIICANLASLDIIDKEPFRRMTLLENSEYVRQEMIQRKLNVRGSSQIIPLLVSESDKAIKLSESLKEFGYWALPIRPPTVPQGEARLRFSLTYDHSREMLKKLIEDIDEIYRQVL